MFWCVGFRNSSAFLMVVSTQIVRITSPCCKFFFKMSQRILWGAVFSSVPVHRDRDSQLQTFPLPLHVHPTILIGNWFTNLGAMMCGKVNTIVVKLMHNTWTELLLTLNDSDTAHFCVAPGTHRKPRGKLQSDPCCTRQKCKKAARGVRFKSGLDRTFYVDTNHFVSNHAFFAPNQAFFMLNEN